VIVTVGEPEGSGAVVCIGVPSMIVGVGGGEIPVGREEEVTDGEWEIPVSIGKRSDGVLLRGMDGERMERNVR